MTPRARKPLDSRSDDFGTRFAIHLRGLLEKRKLATADFVTRLRAADLDVSPVTVKKWLSGERLPLARDFEAIGRALELRDYRFAMPPGI